MGSLEDLITTSWTHAPLVVVAHNAESGHWIPFLHFARRLASEGVVITVVTTDRHAQELEKVTTSEEDIGKSALVRVVGFRDGKVELSHREWTERMLKDQREVVRLMQEVVEDLSSSPSAAHLRGVAVAAPPVRVGLHMTCSRRGHRRSHTNSESPSICFMCPLLPPSRSHCSRRGLGLRKDFFP